MSSVSSRTVSSLQKLYLGRKGSFVSVWGHLSKSQVLLFFFFFFLRG